MKGLKIFVMFAVLVVISGVALGQPVADRKLSWLAPTLNTDGTPVSGPLQYQPICASRADLSDNVVLPMADNTQTSASIRPTDYGWPLEKPLYCAVRTVGSNGLWSNWSSAVEWRVGHSAAPVDNVSPADPALMKFADSDVSDTFVVAALPPQGAGVNYDGYFFYWTTDSYKNVFQGNKVDLGTQLWCFFSTNAKTVYGVFVGYTIQPDGSKRESGYSKMLIWVKGVVQCDDVFSCRVDGPHSVDFTATKRLGDLIPLRPRFNDLYGLPFNRNLLNLTDEQKLDLDGDGWFRQSDVDIIATEFSQRAK